MDKRLTNYRPPRPKLGERRAELIRQQQAAAPRPPETPPARRCGGCRGRRITR